MMTAYCTVFSMCLVTFTNDEQICKGFYYRYPDWLVVRTILLFFPGESTPANCKLGTFQCEYWLPDDGVYIPEKIFLTKNYQATNWNIINDDRLGYGCYHRH